LGIPSAFLALSEWQKKTSDTGLVFPSPITGGGYHAGVIQRKRFKPTGALIGLPGIGWHTARHTYRSLLDETGAPVGVQQKLMRHASITTTMNVYGKAALKAKAQANSKVVEMVMRKVV
jgi:integrase